MFIIEKLTEWLKKFKTLKEVYFIYIYLIEIFNAHDMIDNVLIPQRERFEN